MRKVVRDVARVSPKPDPHPTTCSTTCPTRSRILLENQFPRDSEDKLLRAFRVCRSARHGAVPHTTAQHSTAQHRTAPHSTAQHCTAWFQPRLRTAAASDTYGCSLRHIWLQPPSHTVADARPGQQGLHRGRQASQPAHHTRCAVRGAVVSGAVGSKATVLLTSPHLVLPLLLPLTK